jgi:ubiquinone/menaquinone biosynthesis C-methylase UbiE
MALALFKGSRRMKSMAANMLSPSTGSSPSEAPAQPSRPATSTGGSQAAVSAQYYPYFESRSDPIFGMSEDDVEISPDDGLPVPPDALRSGYGSESAAYLASGRQHHQNMMELVTGSGFAFQDGDRILDFGCSSGRMIRCFKNMAEHHEVWGADISAEHILWCQDHLSPPLRFTTTTTYPHLPFEDNSFGLIYAGSVFTHIGDLEDSWLLELRRILRPGGCLYATVHDNHTIDILISSPPGHWLHDWYVRTMLIDFDTRLGFLRTGFKMFTINVKAGSSQVFHDREYLRRRWGRFLTVRSLHPEAYGYQTAVLMTK